MTFDDVQTLAKGCGMPSSAMELDEEVKLMLAFFHSLRCCLSLSSHSLTCDGHVCTHLPTYQLAFVLFA